VITLEAAPRDVVMGETGISWPSDLENKFHQPDGFVYAPFTFPQTCVDVLGPGYTGCGVHTIHSYRKNTTYYYWYPDNDNVQYLYESFPEVVSPLEGVKSEHFVNWMRTAGLPQFRKLYGIIDANMYVGDQLAFGIQTNFEVASFKGTKRIILTTLADFGNQNFALGKSAIIIGTISAALGIFFSFKQFVYPRATGDIRSLNWK
jgi:LEM3 (ligand-effect modulator 3) family / CDC50 family